MNDEVIAILKHNNIIVSGVCSFADVALRLLDTRNKRLLTGNEKSVIVALFPYYTGEYENANLSKYAVVPDYHMVVGEYLDTATNALKANFPDFSFVPFVDNSPINEVYAAARAGLGVIGKNGLLINKEYGSFVFIGAIVTDMVLDCADAEIIACENCEKCVSVCPSGAIMNKEHCLSKITQKKGELSLQEEMLIKEAGIIWGCDICQNICPHNKDIKKTYIKEFLENIVSIYEKD